jgi:Family of unknown function (DUF6489)
MKITVDIDCTPEEARTFLGLPDVRPMQEQLIQDVQERMAANLKAMDAGEMMKLWMPGGVKSLDQLFELFARKGG